MYQLKIRKKRLLADTVTPVGLYLKIRDKYAKSFLLESSDYHGAENSFSYICCDPIATFRLEDEQVTMKFPDGTSQERALGEERTAMPHLRHFISQFDLEGEDAKYIQSGLFGYMAYDAVQYFEDIILKNAKGDSAQIPQIQYHVFRYIIALDHFKNECYLIECYLDSPNEAGFNDLLNVLSQRNIPSFGFQKSTETTSNFDDNEFLQRVKKGIKHCDLGDVFQVVFSRQFSTGFKGDEFQVYRALRSINPSPYLFYFDYGSYKIFGSSPEAQIVVKDREAVIYPIAGTFKRTGDDAADAALANELLEDPKENSEHIMLVDLARNDLSKSSDDVKVETYKEIQYYSHVIHLVSKVTGQLRDEADPLEIVASTFPAGTLSGAPKYRAMELIDEQENIARGFYGGAIGFMDFKGNFNHAIMIRTFMSRANKLYFQAGAGIVSKSVPESEVQEVYNKLAALESAMEMAETIND
ncbi:anthranilate synthase component I family protein [Marinoscillum furvescens]|uniref:Anthranilate synthase component 1 n=1 Tax=Marinoscillum furvescens DSM 4134 TaxID=1122208 RepID=A0A3D9L238_MARFU|nr:chorismate-binding protein [Marinoscillum furvescens]RED97456.1 anthranilate synthase component 1 [Marinoscillum furvescens DSM 4134]